tara:strand:- start:39 stop:356 length:318 start_codon:yes stop_codon:yes gene_type:complete
MKYTKEIKKDIVTAMTMHRKAGKSIEDASTRVATMLKKRHGKNYKWTGVRSKYYEMSKPKVTKTKSTNSKPPTNQGVREMLMNLTKDSQDITIQVNGREVTAIFK